MNDTKRRPIRELLLGFAALAVSIVSLFPLFWGLFILLAYANVSLNPAFNARPG